ncbi:MyTH4 domain-containing protein [Rozella allomycis CSF55]|uniref:MyTH4 domain-containing protein n=1 Tax=Rozella allomycis (strain CSF55) TaxID=988480 RepID=A0A075B3K9_ROZAC|nr:MyTH4 domain-containing protein [Rozella allomycis CSF55]|eukprot:EPZ35453.1 MyTH4 domain-containing protein [Rozella allomycis CSF55]
MDTNEWVELTDPKSKATFYANPITGDCSWKRPLNVKPRDEENEWWELFDDKHGLPYYYHTKSGKTEWLKPIGVDVIPLIVIQKALANNNMDIQNNCEEIKSEKGSTPSILNEFDVMQMSDIVPPTIAQDVRELSNGERITISAPISVSKRFERPFSESRSLPDDLKTEINQFMIDGFAKKFFATHKRGIFRRKVPVEQMLMFEKDSIGSPLMSMRRELHKDAIKCFKIIQTIMGDRPNKGLNIPEAMSFLLEKGINRGELRDEIYVQLCKQLTKNPNILSIYKGWELMCVLSTGFPPSKNFEEYLKSFIQSRIYEFNDEKIATFCRFALKKLERICRTGPRGKHLTIPEIERIRESPLNPSVFGETLEDIMGMQKNSFPDLKVPRILPFLTEAVLNLGGQKSEGIFRVPADSEKVSELKLRIENDRYDLKDIQDPNIPAALLKLWLRDLAEPLIPSEAYEACIEDPENVERVMLLLQQLPEYNRNVIQYTVKFLQVIAHPDNQPFTKMTVQNIAMVFAPNFLRCPSDNPQVIFNNTKYEQIFLRTLILNLA